MSLVAKAYLTLWGVKYGVGLRVNSLPLCRRDPDAMIEIGKDVRIINKPSENLAGVDHRTVLSASEPGARLLIGNHVGISGAVLYSTKEIVIEDHVMLGAGVRVYDTDFHPVNAASRRSKDQTGIPAESVHIGHDVWVGANVLILKGVTIGPRSVVGAGAVVTKSCPADSLLAGVPARVIRHIENVESRDLGSSETGEHSPCRNGEMNGRNPALKSKSHESSQEDC